MAQARRELAHDDELNCLSQINLSVIDDGEEADFAVLCPV